MDLQKTKIYLDKLNREFQRMTKDPDNIVRLDVDIMASYVRELYDAVLSDEQAHAVVKTESHAHHRKTHTAHRQHEPAVVPEPVASPAPEPIAPPPPVAEVPPPPPPAPEPAPVVAPVAEPPKPAPKEPAAAPHGVDALFEEKQVKELSDKLSELPIPDLKKAIALNDRLLLTSELFAGDGKAFEQAINAVNHLSGFNEAQEYLIEHCVVRYAWTDKKRFDTAKNFIKLVRRRFK